MLESLRPKSQSTNANKAGNKAAERELPIEPDAAGTKKGMLSGSREKPPECRLEGGPVFGISRTCGPCGVRLSLRLVMLGLY